MRSLNGSDNGMYKCYRPTGFLVLLLCSTLGHAAGIYAIQGKAAGDQLQINGVVFRKISDCQDLEEDDAVMFLKGDPYGNCVNAEILILRTKQRCGLRCPVPALEPSPGTAGLESAKIAVRCCVPCLTLGMDIGSREPDFDRRILE